MVPKNCSSQQNYYKNAIDRNHEHSGDNFGEYHFSNNLAKFLQDRIYL